MFICTVRANTIKFTAILLAAAAALVCIIAMSGTSSMFTTEAIAAANRSLKYDKIKTDEDRVSFLSQFGWECDGSAAEEVKIKLPAEFDRIMTEYNELQKSQGLDLHKFKGREIERYTYKITNYPDYDGTVLANLLIYRGRVIGGDICSSDVTGFIHGFEGPTGNIK